MAEYSKISAKAATITGAVLGLICSLFAVVLVSGMGMMYAGISMMGNAFAYFGWISVLYGIVLGAISGFLIAVIYNWSLSIK